MTLTHKEQIQGAIKIDLAKVTNDLDKGRMQSMAWTLQLLNGVRRANIDAVSSALAKTSADKGHDDLLEFVAQATGEQGEMLLSKVFDVIGEELKKLAAKHPGSLITADAEQVKKMQAEADFKNSGFGNADALHMANILH